MSERFELGTEVTFSHRGNTQTGRVVGHEHVAEPRRRCGWHYTIRTSDSQIATVHESQVGGVVGEVACIG